MLENETLLKAARQVVFETTRRNPADSAPLISSGLVDSLSVLRMIARLEEILGISLPTDQLQPEDFDSVDLIVETVRRVTEQ
jgi:acyl carrier protein